MNHVACGIRWHQFGRGSSGYATLAHSSSLPDAVVKKLERFTWGQPRRTSLGEPPEADPGLWIEPIGTFVAVTRICEGPADASGRATLSFFTLLPTREQYANDVLPNLEALLREPGYWTDPGSAAINLVGLKQVSEVALTDIVQRLLTATAVKPRASIVLPPGGLRIEQVAQFLRALPKDQVAEFRVAFRALSDAIAADLVVPDWDYSPEKAAGRRVMLSRSFLEGREQLAETARERVASTKSNATKVPLVSSGAMTACLPATVESDMSKQTMAALAGVAGLVLVFGFANLWLVARNAEETTLSMRQQSAVLQAGIESSVVSINEKHDVTANHLVKAASDQKKRVDDLVKQIEPLRNELAELKREVGDLHSRQAAQAKQHEAAQDARAQQMEVAFIKLQMAVKQNYVKTGTLILAAAIDMLKTALAPRRLPAGVANKAQSFTKE